jgi:hypothetical protein
MIFPMVLTKGPILLCYAFNLSVFDKITLKIALGHGGILMPE